MKNSVKRIIQFKDTFNFIKVENYLILLQNVFPGQGDNFKW